MPMFPSIAGADYGYDLPDPDMLAALTRASAEGGQAHATARLSPVNQVEDVTNGLNRLLEENARRRVENAGIVAETRGIQSRTFGLNPTAIAGLGEVGNQWARAAGTGQTTSPPGIPRVNLQTGQLYVDRGAPVVGHTPKPYPTSGVLLSAGGEQGGQVPTPSGDWNYPRGMPHALAPVITARQGSFVWDDTANGGRGAWAYRHLPTESKVAPLNQAASPANPPPQSSSVFATTTEGPPLRFGTVPNETLPNVAPTLQSPIGNPPGANVALPTAGVPPAGLGGTENLVRAVTGGTLPSNLEGPASATPAPGNPDAFNPFSPNATFDPWDRGAPAPASPTPSPTPTDSALGGRNPFGMRGPAGEAGAPGSTSEPEWYPAGPLPRPPLTGLEGEQTPTGGPPTVSAPTEGPPAPPPTTTLTDAGRALLARNATRWTGAHVTIPAGPTTAPAGAGGPSVAAPAGGGELARLTRALADVDARRTLGSRDPRRYTSEEGRRHREDLSPTNIRRVLAPMITGPSATSETLQQAENILGRAMGSGLFGGGRGVSPEAHELTTAIATRRRELGVIREMGAVESQFTRREGRLTSEAAANRTSAATEREAVHGTREQTAAHRRYQAVQDAAAARARADFRAVTPADVAAAEADYDRMVGGGAQAPTPAAQTAEVRRATQYLQQPGMPAAERQKAIAFLRTRGYDERGNRL